MQRCSIAWSVDIFLHCVRTLHKGCRLLERKNVPYIKKYEVDYIRAKYEFSCCEFIQEVSVIKETILSITLCLRKKNQ